MKTNNVTSIVSFDKIDPSDLKAGFTVYSNIERQVDGLRLGVAPWVHSVASYFFEKSDCIAEVAVIDFKAGMEKYVTWITSLDAGQLQLTSSQAKLSGHSPLAAAYRKMFGTLDMGGDLRKLTTVRQCEDYNKKAREAAKAKEAAAAMDKAITGHCKANLLREEDNGIEKDVDWETDEHAKLMLSESIAEYKEQRKEGNHLDVLEGGGESAEESTREPDQFDEMGAKIANRLRDLYVTKAEEIGAKSALTEVTTRFNSTCEKLIGATSQSIASLKSELKQTA